MVLFFASMDLRNHITATRGRAVELARQIGVHPVLIRQWASGSRAVPIEHCAALERATGGAVSRRSLRPADWERIWPELATTQEQAAPHGGQVERRGVAPPEQHHGLSPFAMGVDRREHGDAELADEGAR